MSEDDITSTVPETDRPESGGADAIALASSEQNAATGQVASADAAAMAAADFGDNVTLLEKDGRSFYIIGTAHVSAKSVEEVAHVIETLRPDTVCVELCATRHQALTQENQWKKLDVVQVIRQGKALMLLANLALSSFQRKMGEKMGVKPGAELLMGVTKAKEVGAELVLADRDIQVTLKRTWGNLSFFKKMMVLSGLFESVISKEEISEEDLEKMKERDQLSAMMDEFAKAMPEVKEPLIDERDRFLMSMIEEAPGKTVVAVVGAGHVKGMVNHFGKPVDRDAINLIPEPSIVWRVLKWVVPLAILALFARGYFLHQGESLQDMLMAWVLPNAVGAGVFTIIAGGRFLTVLSAAAAAPITSLNPAIGAGMVAGLVEALLRKPNVADCENIPEDIQSVRGFYRNPVTRVLLVFFLSSLGSAIGTWVGLSWLIKIVT